MPNDACLYSNYSLATLVATHLPKQILVNNQHSCQGTLWKSVLPLALLCLSSIVNIQFFVVPLSDPNFSSLDDKQCYLLKTNNKTNKQNHSLVLVNCLQQQPQCLSEIRILLHKALYNSRDSKESREDTQTAHEAGKLLPVLRSEIREAPK